MYGKKYISDVTKFTIELFSSESNGIILRGLNYAHDPFKSESETEKSEIQRIKKN